MTMRVLIADDTEDIRNLLRLMLQRDGRFSVVGEARDGQEAVAIAKETKPEAIVLDLSMPVMDGLEALPHLRRLLPECRIVVLSGFNASLMAREALTAGADAYIEKGAAFGRLITCLLDLALEHGTPAASAESPPETPPTTVLDTEQLVRDAVAAAGGSNDLRTAFDGFCRVAVQAIPFDRASFWVADEDGSFVCAAVDDDTDRLGVGSKLVLTGRARRVLLGQPIVEPDTETETGDVTNSLLHAHGIRSSLCLPLVIGGTTKAIVCFSADRPYGFSFEDVPFASRLGRETASTFHLLHLLDCERALGSRLREADALKNDLVGIVAHDLRSPMTVIGGYAQYLHDGWTTMDEPQKLEFLDTISRNIQDLAQIVDDMLEVSSLESGGLSCNVEPFDLSEMIRSTVSEMAMTDAGRTCLVTLPAQLPTALGDPGRQRQVLTNLISNAFKFSPPSSPVEIAVTTDGDAIEVSVSDEGFGIADEQLGVIFEKFYRVTGAGRPKVPGSGLGLYICRLLVEAQDGRIWAESVPGKGSTFRYTIPVVASSAASAA
jgi:signal transduction histidine kinase/ActR/RegA family two-component response regulator